MNESLTFFKDDQISEGLTKCLLNKHPSLLSGIIFSYLLNFQTEFA